MTPNDIETLAGVLQRHDISACEVHDDSCGGSIKLWLRTGAPPSQAQIIETAAAVATANAPDVVRSPGMGRFAACHPLQESPAAMPDQRVEAGQAVGYLLAGSLIDEITAPRLAVLGRPLVEEGELVGYGDAVFELH